MSSTEAGGVRPKKRDAGSAAALRKFGFVMAGALALLGAIAWWRGRAAAPWLGGAGGLFLVFALVRPRWLAPVERAWMKVAEVMGAVMTFVILTLTFFLVLTPVGVARRLFGADTLGLRYDRAKKTYWTPVEPNGPPSRPDKPY